VEPFTSAKAEGTRDVAVTSASAAAMASIPNAILLLIITRYYNYVL
jgi:hypothetical protein